MFNWLGNLFPYSDLHSLNLDWLLSKMKETAALAAKAIADAANALAQVAEAKAAALSAQTAAKNAQTAANEAATNAANAAASATAAVNTANAAQTAAQNAQTAAQNAQNTANAANTAAQSAKDTATSAKTVADSALSKFPVGTSDIADSAITTSKIENGSIVNSKLMDNSIYPSKLTDSKFSVEVSNAIAGDPALTEYTGEAKTFSVSRASSGRVAMFIFKITVNGEYLSVSVPGDTPTGYNCVYRTKVITNDGKELIVAVTVRNEDVIFNIDNYTDVNIGSSIPLSFHMLYIKAHD